MMIDALKKKLAVGITMAKQQPLAHIIILILWITFQVWLGNKFYAAFILFFFLALSSLRRPYFMILGLSVLMIVLADTPLIKNWTEFQRINLEAIKQTDLPLSNMFKPNSGQGVLPAETQQILSMLKANNISSYELSDFLMRDSFIQQRTIEAAWPIKLKHKSPRLFCSIEELKAYPNCVLVDKREAVALVLCP